MSRQRQRIRLLIRLTFVALLPMDPACAATPPPTPTPAKAIAPRPHHELHLAPARPEVSVALDGKPVELTLRAIAPDGVSASLVDVWRRAFPTEDPGPLHFDLVGSDGFHPAARPACARLLTGAEIALARIDVASHDVSFDESLELPGCYRVKGGRTDRGDPIGGSPRTVLQRRHDANLARSGGQRQASSG